MKKQLLSIALMASSLFAAAQTPYQVADVYPGSFGSNPQSLVDVDGTLYFTAIGVGTNRELFKYNGDTTVLVKDFSTNSTSFVTNLTPNGKYLHLMADTSGTGNPHYVRFNTEDSTFHYNGPLYASEMSVVNGTLFFQGSISGDGELWADDGTGEYQVKDIQNPASSSPRYIVDYNNTAYFAAFQYWGGGTELWKSDGSETGTERVVDLNTTGAQTSSNPKYLTVMGDNIFFNAN